MSCPRALLLLAMLASGTALLPACDRSVTAPPLRPAQVALAGTDALASANSSALVSASTLLPGVGGTLELAPSAGSLVSTTLQVPAGALVGPTIFDVTQEPATTGWAISIASRQVTDDAAALGDDPILLSLSYTGEAGTTREVTVTFLPPDGSEPIVEKVTLRGDRATTLGFRRGRSKYSVIYF